MVSIGLAMYEIKVKRKRTSDYFKLSEIPNSNRETELLDLFVLFNNIIELGMDGWSNDDQDKGIVLTEKTTDSRIIYGKFDYGEYGNKRTIRKSEGTFDEEGAVEPEQLIASPYYFLIKIPIDSETGILITERKRGIGIKNMILKGLRNNLNGCTKFRNYILEINRAVPQELINQFINNGSIMNLKFFKREANEDWADIERIELRHFETKVKVGKQTMSPQEYIDERGGSLLVFQDVPYDLLRVESKYQGTTKSFVIDDPDSIMPYIDITDEIEIDREERNPDPTSIDEIARRHARENFREIWYDD